VYVAEESAEQTTENPPAAGNDQEQTEQGEAAEKMETVATVPSEESIDNTIDNESLDADFVGAQIDERTKTDAVETEKANDMPSECRTGSVDKPAEKDGTVEDIAVLADVSGTCGNNKNESSMSPKSESVDMHNSGANGEVCMDTSNSGVCDQLTTKTAQVEQDTSGDRKRQLSQDSVGSEEDTGNAAPVPKRSRLDGLIGKLGERVPLIPVMADKDILEEEDESISGDLDSMEKQSEEDLVEKQSEEDSVEKQSEEDSVEKQSEEDSVEKQSEEDYAEKWSEEDSAEKQSEGDSAEKQSEEDPTEKLSQEIISCSQTDDEDEERPSESSEKITLTRKASVESTYSIEINNNNKSWYVCCPC
jgi:hypothetical protein